MQVYIYMTAKSIALNSQNILHILYTILILVIKSMIYVYFKQNVTFFKNIFNHSLLLVISNY